MHAVQLAPVAPHADGSVPARHMLPDRQPVQQAPDAHVPPVHAAPSVAGVHAPLVHALHSPHAVHAAPPVPHAPSAVPPWHALPSQQPVQQAPLMHVPDEQVVPSAAGVHAPASQASHPAHAPQAPPSAPHAPTPVPSRHAAPSQQPVQHVPPWHVPAVHPAPSARGTQTDPEHVSHSRQSVSVLQDVATQAPLSHRSPVAHAPHEPPQPSSPQVLPPQDGVQQAPETHTPVAQGVLSAAGPHAPALQVSHAAHATHMEAALPHASGAVPASQVVPETHPVQQVPAVQTPPGQVVPSMVGAHVPARHEAHGPQSASTVHAGASGAPLSTAGASIPESIGMCWNSMRPHPSARSAASHISRARFHIPVRCYHLVTRNSRLCARGRRSLPM